MIVHVDMDAFYASVEEREQPQLQGQPLVVGGRPEARGVVAAANYAARQYGVRSAMPMSAAIKRCPQLIILPLRSEVYAAVSAQIRAIFNRFTPIVEPLSLDEAFLDPAGSERLHGSAEEIGRKIKHAIRAELGLVASVGVAANKFLAKLASDHDKPDGFTVIEPGQVQAFLDALPVSRIWGVGKAAEARLAARGVYSVRDLRARSSAFLLAEFGQNGVRLWDLIHGIDPRRVVPNSAAKSISQETTLAEDICTLAEAEAVALSLAEGVGFRLRAAELRGRTVTLKLRFADFATITRARSLIQPTDSTSIIWASIKTLIRKNLSRRRFALRLIGVGVSNFDNPTPQQSELFDPPGQAAAVKVHQLDALSDRITRRYGKNSIRRGRTLRRR